MRTSAILLAALGIVSLCLASGPSARAHRYPGLAVADITFQNANDIRVRNPVVSCEFFDPKGKLLATRGSTVFQSFPPGKKKIDGVEFSLREKNAVPGSCRVISVSTVGGPN